MGERERERGGEQKSYCIIERKRERGREYIEVWHTHVHIRTGARVSKTGCVADAHCPSPFLIFPSLSVQGNLSPVPIILSGTVTGGRFGMSVLNIGDIDQDGFEGK